MTVLDLRRDGTGVDVPERPVRFRRVERDEVLTISGAAAAALALVWLVFERLTPAGGGFGFALAWFAVFLVLVWLVGREVYDRVRARDLVAKVAFWSAGVVIVAPLVAIVVYTIGKGISSLRPQFFLEDQSFVGATTPPTEGGAVNAIVGSLQQVGIAALISVPLGVAGAVFLNEVGGRLARPVRMVVDAMSAIPSIVAGLFIYSAFIIALGGELSGFAGALALTVLMLPTVMRTTELVLRLVPGGLREAGLALGATDWRTTRGVVLPTARSGIATAVILGVARVIGETAPLILTIFGNPELKWNPITDKQTALPLYIYQQVFIIRTEASVQRAWTGALVLLLLVLGLFITARIIGGRGPDHIGRLRRARLAREGLA